MGTNSLDAIKVAGVNLAVDQFTFDACVAACNFRRADLLDWHLEFTNNTSMRSRATILLWSSVQWRPRFHANAQALADIMPFSVSLVANDLLWPVSQRADQGFIGRGLGVEAVGSYSKSNRS